MKIIHINRNVIQRNAKRELEDPVVRIEENGKTTVGQAADTDTLVASANAYLNALNKLIIKRKRTAPDASVSASA